MKRKLSEMETNEISGGFKVVADGCIACGRCAEECPCGAIFLADDGRYEINQGLCMTCGHCAEICPCNTIDPYEY